ncbi:MAG: glycosyltransferase family 2 protein [Candidatus Peribacteraceae bacterium]|nr:glycosyltransferase family 2 protein [Candidatus Peribacteraceae bacterium]
MLSIIVPVYNEENAVKQTVDRLTLTLSKEINDWEIILINDGSTDGTKNILDNIASKNILVLHNIQNIGYSSSIKRGIKKASGQLLAITDADGTYPVEELPAMLKQMNESKVDMIVGARTKKKVHIPFVRKPAKVIIAILANFLVGEKIPDINSGLRIFTRELAEKFWHLYPQRFSFTITITLAALTNSYQVEFYPIEYSKRIGKSTLSSGTNGLKNFFSFIGLIIRITTYFRPLKFFTIPSLILSIGGVALMICTITTQQNISDSGMLLFVTGLQIGIFGLLADNIARNGQRKF